MAAGAAEKAADSAAEEREQLMRKKTPLSLILMMNRHMMLSGHPSLSLAVSSSSLCFHSLQSSER